MFLEPIALYMTRDLCETKDGEWQFPYPPPDEAVPLGEGRVYDENAADLTILTFGNGVYMSLRAAKVLRERHDVHARVVDLRWVLPLNAAFIVEQSRATGRVLVVDEGRRSGGVGEGIVTLLVEHGCGELPMSRIAGEDTYIPLGPAAYEVLPQEADIVRQAAAMCAGERASAGRRAARAT
jgi:2-oxoisovalerate dehydrogenase E1 component